MQSISFFSQLFTFKLQSDVRSLCNYNTTLLMFQNVLKPRLPLENNSKTQLLNSRQDFYSAFNFNPDRANKLSNEGVTISSPAFSTNFAHASASAPARW